MEGPTCRLCGKKHWSRQPCGAAKPVLSEVKATVTKIRVTKKKKGRPKKVAVLDAAERARRYRERQKEK